MIFFWEALGPIKYPLAFSLVAVALLSSLSAARLVRPSAWAELRVSRGG
jgi:hypothetical protein